MLGISQIYSNFFVYDMVCVYVHMSMRTYETAYLKNHSKNFIKIWYDFGAQYGLKCHMVAGPPEFWCLLFSIMRIRPDFVLSHVGRVVLYY